MCLHMWHVHNPIMNRVTQAGSNERETEGERTPWVCYFMLCMYLEFTTQGGPFQVHLITALLHIKPKRIKEPELFIIASWFASFRMARQTREMAGLMTEGYRALNQHGN